MEKSDCTIDGWELNNPDPELFDTEVLEVFGECRNCEAIHQCRTPQQSVRRLVPTKGKLIQIGCEQVPNGDTLAYIAWVHEKETRFILLQKPRQFWAKALFVSKEDLPEWVRAKLVA